MIHAILASVTLAQWTELPCTMHDYEGPLASNPKLYDNSAPYCGQRYSILNVARIVALPNMNPSLCNQCIEIKGDQTVYVLAVDQREAYGLDIASSSYQALFPNDNVLNPHTCSYRVVDSSYCGQICQGSSQECTTGAKNDLPGYLLPEMGTAAVGLSASGSSNSGDQNKKSNSGQQQQTSQSNQQVQITTTTTTKPSTTTRTSAMSSPTSQVFGSTPETIGSRPVGGGVVSSAMRLSVLNLAFFLILFTF